MCGSANLIKKDGVYVCQNCGCKYSLEEAKKLLFEGTVKIDNSEKINNLYVLARRSREEHNFINASNYYEKILQEEPNSWEPAFYSVYCKAKNCRIADIYSECINVKNCIPNTLQLVINDNVTIEEKTKIFNQLYKDCLDISNEMYDAAVAHWSGIDNSIKLNYANEMMINCHTAREILLAFGDCLRDVSSDEQYLSLIIQAWKGGLNSPWFKDLKKTDVADSYVKKIQKYEPDYQLPPRGGCYVATCVYGSYNCSQVWTLRRYRDYKLAKTWHGRAFIHIYYAISPVLVKWFGRTKWFKRLWKGRLDKMVSKLQKQGFDNSPYEDKKW